MTCQATRGISYNHMHFPRTLGDGRKNKKLGKAQRGDLSSCLAAAQWQEPGPRGWGDKALSPRAIVRRYANLWASPFLLEMGIQRLFLLILQNDETACSKHFINWKVLNQHKSLLLLSRSPVPHRALFSYLTTGFWGSQPLENESPVNRFWGVLVVKVYTVQQIRQKY